MISFTEVFGSNSKKKKAANSMDNTDLAETPIKDKFQKGKKKILYKIKISICFNYYNIFTKFFFREKKKSCKLN